jgi:hypothetical protein
MTVTIRPQLFPNYSSSEFSSLIIGDGNESEFVAKFSSNPISIMSSKSGATHCTAPTTATSTMMMSEWTLGSITSSSSASEAASAESHHTDNDSLFRFSASATNSPTSSSSRRSHPATIASSSASHHKHEFDTNFDDLVELASTSIETPLNMKPYVTAPQETRSPPNLQPYVVMYSSSSSQQPQKRSQPAQQQRPPAQQPQQQQHRQHRSVQQQQRSVQQQQQPAPSPSPPQPQPQQRRRNHDRLPRVTYAATPFEKTIAPTSYLHDELSKDDAYNHAMKCGIIWQSLVGQHVKFPSLWYDGEEPARPYMGCPSKSNKWSFFGRHRMTTSSSNNMLRSLVPNTNSSGKLLLHIIVIDSNTLEPTEDIVIGVYHPNAMGIRPLKSSNVADSQRLDECRDIWIGHRSRSVPVNGRRNATRIESLLRHLNHSSVDKSPLGSPKNESSSGNIPYKIDNTNMNSIYGRNPPKSTLFVPENKLYKLLMPPQQQSNQQQQQQHQQSRGRRTNNGGRRRRGRGARSPSPKRTTPVQQQQRASVILMKTFLQ